jgi:hypothetical protein
VARGLEGRPDINMFHGVKTMLRGVVGNIRLHVSMIPPDKLNSRMVRDFPYEDLAYVLDRFHREERCC